VEAFPVFIGFDSREVDEFQVAKKSLIRRSSVPLHVQGLYREALEWPGDDGGIYTRSWYQGARDQWIDRIDGRPFSTEFSFTRFSVPLLMQYRGWALFHDSDMIWQADIAELLEFRDEKYAVQVVKHMQNPTETVKMDGRVQTTYDRKNWSSFVLWNCAHPANRQLHRGTLNAEPGSWLHGFRWLKDDEIGEIPLEWNFLVGVNKPENLLPGIKPAVLHFTLGTPEMAGYEDCEFSDRYWWEKHRPSTEYGSPPKSEWDE
jgi:lipopolysaccharide biosynthesis glycosyltransferase